MHPAQVARIDYAADSAMYSLSQWASDMVDIDTFLHSNLFAVMVVGGFFVSLLKLLVWLNQRNWEKQRELERLEAHEGKADDGSGSPK